MKGGSRRELELPAASEVSSHYSAPALARPLPSGSFSFQPKIQKVLVDFFGIRKVSGVFYEAAGYVANDLDFSETESDFLRHIFLPVRKNIHVEHYARL